MTILFLVLSLAGAVSTKPAQPELLADEVAKLESDNLDNAVEAAMADAARTHARIRWLLGEGAASLRRAPLQNSQADDASMSAELLERKSAAYAVSAGSVSVKLVELDWRHVQGLRPERNRLADLSGAAVSLKRARQAWGRRPAGEAEQAMLADLDSALGELRAASELWPPLKIHARVAQSERDLLDRQLELARFTDR